MMRGNTRDRSSRIRLVLAGTGATEDVIITLIEHISSVKGHIKQTVYILITE